MEQKHTREELSIGISIFKFIILFLICILAFAIRLFAVVRYESVIHEYDPYFNYRATKFLTTEGYWEFLNWFDERSWYPLGRVVGGTIYPGLMVTTAAIFHFIRWLNIPINIRDMCVFLAPMFSAFTAMATYLLTEEVVATSPGPVFSASATGLLAAALVAVVPSYISRSVAGSFDNEGVAIFALVSCFYLWIKSVNTGSMGWACGCACAYFYMTASWGGHVLIINLIPLYVCIMACCGRYSKSLYTAYSTVYCIGLLMAVTVPFVGFNVLFQAESAASHGVFATLQIYTLVQHITGPQWTHYHQSEQILRGSLRLGGVVSALALAVWLAYLQVSGGLQWSGRSLSLLDPSYASSFIPIIASVSEHQPTTWTAFCFDLHVLVLFAPLGVLTLYSGVSDAAVFVLLYGAVAWYFAGVMVRLMLTLAPIACILSAIGVSRLLVKPFQHLNAVIRAEAHDILSVVPYYTSHCTPIYHYNRIASTVEMKPKLSSSYSCGLIGLVWMSLCCYGFHACYASSLAYSSPSIVIDMGKNPTTGERVLYDDFREAYFWLRQNTPEDAKVLSWWDYGYQLASMSNRTTLVDNNTWNTTHIATVGRVLASTEEDAYPILESLDVDYILVIFGGVTGYASDDINKFLWPVRIGSQEFPEMPKEHEYYSTIGEFDIGSNGGEALLNSMTYKLCYYNFNLVHTEAMQPSGYDRARGRVIANSSISLDTVEEAFTSEHWMVRIYKVLKREHLDYGMEPHPLLLKQRKLHSNKGGGYSANRATSSKSKKSKKSKKKLSSP